MAGFTCFVFEAVCCTCARHGLRMQRWSPIWKHGDEDDQVDV